jgi:hypothetical protein
MSGQNKIDFPILVAAGSVNALRYRGPITISICSVYVPDELGTPESLILVETVPCSRPLTRSRSFRAEVIRVLRDAHALGAGEYRLVPGHSSDGTWHSFRGLTQDGRDVLREFYLANGARPLRHGRRSVLSHFTRARIARASNDHVLDN